MDNIGILFTSEDKDELRQAFKEIIKEQFQTDLEQYDFYMFDPNVIENMVNEAFEEVIDEVKAEFKGMAQKKIMAILKK
jgi:hypothetical protein